MGCFGFTVRVHSDGYTTGTVHHPPPPPPHYAPPPPHYAPPPVYSSGPHFQKPHGNLI